MIKSITLRIAALAIAAASVGPFAATPAFAETLPYRVINEGDSVIQHIYMSPAGDDLWGPDHLGAEVLMPGEELNLSVTTDTAGCYFDVRYVDENGIGTVKWDADVCAYESLIIH